MIFFFFLCESVEEILSKYTGIWKIWETENHRKKTIAWNKQSVSNAWILLGLNYTDEAPGERDVKMMVFGNRTRIKNTPTKIWCCKIPGITNSLPQYWKIQIYTCYGYVDSFVILSFILGKIKAAIKKKKQKTKKTFKTTT